METGSVIWWGTPVYEMLSTWIEKPERGNNVNVEVYKADWLVPVSI